MADDHEEHELIIEEIASDGNSEEIIASEEIEGESTNTIIFNPQTEYENLEYYLNIIQIPCVARYNYLAN